MKKEKIIHKNQRIIGNEHVVEYLKKSIKNKKLVQTYIFSGPELVGKVAAARFFAQILFCENQNFQNNWPCNNCEQCQKFIIKETDEEKKYFHSDYYEIKPEEGKKNISIEQVRDFIKSLNLSSFLNSYKFGLIKQAETLSLGAANALLKTLEEPKNKVIIVLLVSNLALLPKTVLSRSQILNFRLVKNDIIYDFLVKEKGLSRSLAKNITRLSLGRPDLAIKLSEEKDFFDNYQAMVKNCLNIFDPNINERLNAVETLLGKNLSKDNARVVKKVIQISLGLARDLLMLSLGQNNLVQNEIEIDSLHRLLRSNNLEPKTIAKSIHALLNGFKYLKNNVNPRLVMDEIAIKII